MPVRGEVWFVDLNPTRGHEQRGERPALVVSADQFNQGRSGLVVVCPITTTDRGIPLQVRIDPPDGGLERTSFVMTEAVRSISTERLDNRKGSVSAQTMAKVSDRLRILLEL